MSRAAPRFWHLPVLVATCAAYESLFISHGVNIVDEGWPLYAARRWLEGAPLYSDAFFVFPPGHLLPAVAGLLLDPPGLVVSRLIYALFQILCAVGIYLYGRRVMPASYALFGALLIGLATPRSHLAHHVFGYRYMAFSLVSMLLFARRHEGGPRSLFFWSGLACAHRLLRAARFARRRRGDRRRLARDRAHLARVDRGRPALRRGRVAGDRPGRALGAGRGGP